MFLIKAFLIDHTECNFCTLARQNTYTIICIYLESCPVGAKIWLRLTFKPFSCERSTRSGLVKQEPLLHAAVVSQKKGRRHQERSGA